jgi:hypothetical protein
VIGRDGEVFAFRKEDLNRISNFKLKKHAGDSKFQKPNSKYLKDGGLRWLKKNVKKMKSAIPVTNPALAISRRKRLMPRRD